MVFVHDINAYHRILACPFGNVQLETGMPEVIISLFQLILHVKAMQEENVVFCYNLASGVQTGSNDERLV